jgi:isopenicillin-N epimerase
MIPSLDPREVPDMQATRRSLLQGGALLGAAAALKDGWLESVAHADERKKSRAPQELASDEDYWAQIQQAFTIDRSVINLNNGSLSPSPRVVQEAMAHHLAFTHEHPARNLWTVLLPQLENVRTRLARTFGCDREEMAITRNASESLEICIYGVDLKPGDEVLLTEHDYPRVITTYEQRARREGIKLVRVPVPAPAQSREELVAAYAKGITGRTRVIVVSHVTFLTGQIMPVREIVALGREHGIPVIVDGAHAFAHLAFTRDDLGCDYYATSLHKWTCAPHGTGFLYVRESAIEKLWPLMAAPVAMDKDIRKFEEIGTNPVATKLPIAEALVFHEAIGSARKEARLRTLRDRWANRLSADKRIRLYTRLEPEHSCAVTTFGWEGIEPVKVVEHLWNRHKIAVTVIDFPGIRGLRVTPNVYTTVSEIDQFSMAIEDVLANGLPA